MKHIEALLRRKLGLDARAVGLAGIERVVRRRMQALNLPRPKDYAAVLETTPAEWESFLESVVVCETWFFRERAAFRALVELVQTEWFPRHPLGRCRVLSVACSSGEEPYSIVMALLDAGVPPGRFSVEGVDVSARALERARRGVFGKNSFRGRDLQFRERYFRRTAEGYELHSLVREGVKFYRANILDSDFLGCVEPYDFVFCRNLLIYFDPATQNRTLARLRQLLTSDGVLFVGAAELAAAAANGFAPMRPPLALACRPNRPPGQSSARSQPARPERPFTMAASADTAAGAAAPKGRPTESHAAHAAPPGVSPEARTLEAADLDAARQLADAGHLADAHAVCHAHIQRHGPTAAAFHLLGLLHDARGETAHAIECYRKALYLDPNHLEALVHLALLLERNGEAAEARVFRSRAERVRARRSAAQPVEL
ncbi:MAG: hypothetical protein N3I86_03940 [Verrucomicrobiae bacterium]|nr:hypothetical protein [Verrucomicrobiae bacterium]